MNGIREVFKRDKRNNSVVITGMRNKSEHKVKDVFNGACPYLSLGVIKISDLAKLSPSVWSEKVLDTSSGPKLLFDTKWLRSIHVFKDNFIQRNPTYRQRMELLVKKARGNNKISGANAIPNAPSQQNNNKTELLNRNRNVMSLAQQNHGTRDQSQLYNGVSCLYDNSRDSREAEDVVEEVSAGMLLIPSLPTISVSL